MVQRPGNLPLPDGLHPGQLNGLISDPGQGNPSMPVSPHPNRPQAISAC